MPKFMIRVELHQDAQPPMYEQLDTAMAKHGFARELPGKKAAYLLPVGNYWYEGKSTTNDLRRTVATAAQSTGQDFGIAVVRANGWSVMRLERAKTSPRAD